MLTHFRLIPIVAVRLFYLSPSKNHDPTITSIIPQVWAEGALEFAIISTSITALKPFLKPFHSGAIVNTVGGAGSGAYSGSGSRTQGVYMLNSVHDDDKDIGLATTNSSRSNKGKGSSGHQTRGKLYRGNTVDGTAVVSSQSQHDRHREDMESLDSNSSEQMIIRTMKDWTVRYENS
jgi:hypothetical protein